jgi:hypothetical protein
MRCRLFTLAIVSLLLLPSVRAAADWIDFEDLFLPPKSYYNGSDGAGGFLSQGAIFNNDYNTKYQSWRGWAYSNTTDVQTPSFLNQYSAFALPNGGGDGSANYGVAFNYAMGDAYVILPEGTRPTSARITNTTYAALTMLLGDPFAKKFGGPTGTDPDWFVLSIYGVDEEFNLTGWTYFVLADYTFEDSRLDYIVAEWTTVDLTPLGNARYLLFDLNSSDVGKFGMNTPAYFALDNLRVEPRR